eukprot:7555146-Pyramimonas_sp.AAC.1
MVQREKYGYDQPVQFPRQLRPNGWSRSLRADNLSARVFDVDNPEKLSGQYMATVAPRIFDNAIFWDMPDGSLATEFRPRWDEISQILRIAVSDARPDGGVHGSVRLALRRSLDHSNDGLRTHRPR